VRAAAVLALCAAGNAMLPTIDIDGMAALAGRRLAGRLTAPVMPLPQVLGVANSSYTVVLMHGLGDSSENPGMQSLATSLEARYPGMYTLVAPVANFLDSIFTPMTQQVDEFAAAVRADPNLAEGFSALGLSQGGLVVRGYIQKYNDPPVRNFVSICGVMNGAFDCPLEVQIIPFACELWKSNPFRFLFNSSVLSFSEYFVLYATDAGRTEYLTENAFLPPLNNEVVNAFNATGKKNIRSLAKLAVIGATQDTMLIPWQAAQFGGYVTDSDKTVYGFTEGPHYTQDLIGLRELYDDGRMDLLSFDGDHLRFNSTYWEDVVLPYFDN